MFTGIIETLGRIAAVERIGRDARFRINAGAAFLKGVRVGDSIAVNGTCLTAMRMGRGSFSADVSGETLDCTTLGAFTVGDAVNLEKALTPSTPLGGHIVTGHVDGTGRIKSRRADGRSIRFDIEVPQALARYVAAKGSVCLDGVSLTVNTVSRRGFGVNIIPHTAEMTTIGAWVKGRRVNVEVDLLARYLERLRLQ